MIPPFNANGLLPGGIHLATWAEFSARYGFNDHRRRLLRGFPAAVLALKEAGCRMAYIDGSFVTQKEVPGDFDACWDPTGVSVALLDPVLLDFKNLRAAQKAKFGGELFPSQWNATGAFPGNTFLEFFQIDKSTGDPKGIVAMDLGGWTP